MKIILLGDIAFYGKYSISDNLDIYKYFSKISQFLKKYDYVIGNLETPFSENTKPYGAKSAHIKSDPNNVKLLNFLNINIVNLANNHMYDYGKKGYLLTKKILNKEGIQYFGIENQQLLINKNNNKIALHGYCGYLSNPLGIYNERYGINALSIPKVEANLKKNSKLGYLNIISVHNGQEHVNYPSYEDIQMARQFSKICPYVYYGHHPHVMQGMEKYNNSLIAYSLGNFCFDDVYTDKSNNPLIKQSENNKTAFMLELEIENSKVINYKTIPIYLGELSLEIDSIDTLNALDAYSKKLNEDKIIYIQKRTNLINKYIESRKSMRNLKWYAKRLKLKYVIMIFRSKYNIYKHKKNITNFLIKDI